MNPFPDLAAPTQPQRATVRKRPAGGETCGSSFASVRTHPWVGGNRSHSRKSRSIPAIDILQAHDERWRAAGRVVAVGVGVYAASWLLAALWTVEESWQGTTSSPGTRTAYTLTLSVETAATLLAVFATVVIALYVAARAAPEKDDIDAISYASDRIRWQASMIAALLSVIVGLAAFFRGPSSTVDLVGRIPLLGAAGIIALLAVDTAPNREDVVEAALGRQRLEAECRRLESLLSQWEFTDETNNAQRWAITQLSSLVLGLAAIPAVWLLVLAMPQITVTRAVTAVAMLLLISSYAVLAAIYLTYGYVVNLIDRQFAFCGLIGFLAVFWVSAGVLAILEALSDDGLSSSRRCWTACLLATMFFVTPALCALGLSASWSDWQRFRPARVLRWQMRRHIVRRIRRLEQSGQTTESSPAYWKRLWLINRVVRWHYRVSGQEALDSSRHDSVKPGASMKGSYARTAAF